MTPWQVLRAGRATQAASGHRVRRGHEGLVYYSTAPAAAGPDCSRSFCLSRKKVTLQQLNGRLAAYLQQVHSLEAANRKLESQIQKELDRKSPRELSQLDGHLRTASWLQDQICECLSAQAQVKLQLLNAELTVFDLSVRCEKERERRGCLEEELSDLRLLEEELQVHRLPELQILLNDQRQQLNGLQMQHQQDMQGLLAQMSGGVTVEMQPLESLDLIQQLDDLRQTSVTQLDRNQNECRFNTQVSMLSSPEVTFDRPAGSEVIQAELEELRRTAASLEDELTQLQTLNMMMEASRLEQNQSFVQQLGVLQQRADSLCTDLDSVLHATAHQAADHQTLLDVKTRLETEIQDYRRLLDGLNPQEVSSLQPNSATNVTSFCVRTSPSALRRNIIANKTVSVQGGSLKMMDVQAASRGHILTVGQTPIVAPLLETGTTVWSVGVHDKQTKNSPVISVNTSNLTGSFLICANQRTGALPVENQNNTDNNDHQSSSVGSTHISQGLDKEGVVKDLKTKTNTEQGITTLVLDTQSVRSAAQVKTETITSKTTTQAGLQANETGKTILCAEQEIMKVSDFITHSTTTEPSTQTSTEVKKETVQKNSTEVSIQAKNQDHVQVVPLSLELQASKTAHRIISLVPDTQPTRCAIVQEKSETFTSKQSTTEAGLQANETETNIQTVTTKTILCAKAEETQEPDLVTNTTIVDPSKQTAAELQKETETVVSTQKNCTEVSIQAKNQDLAQVVPLSLEIQAEVVGDVGEVAETASCVSGSRILMSEETQDKVSGDVTLDIERQGKKGEEEVEGALPALRLDQTSALSHASNSEQNKTTEDTDTGSGIDTGSSGVQNSNDNLESKIVEKIISCVPDTQPTRSAAVQEKSETFISKQTTTEAGLQANETETNIQTVTTKTILCAKAEETQEPDLVTNTTIVDPSKQTAAELQKETETVVSAERNFMECSILAKNQDPAPIVPLSLEIQAETVVDAGEVAAIASCVSGSHILSSEKAQGKVSGVSTLIDDEDIERQEKKEEKEVVKDEGALLVLRLDQSSALSDESNSKQNKVMEDADTGSGINAASTSNPDSSGNPHKLSKTALTEKLKNVELQVNKEKVVTSFHDTNEPKVDPTESDNEMLNLAGQEASLRTTESKKSAPQTDSGVALSSSNAEELLSPREAHVGVSPTKPVACLNPEIFLSPVETEVSKTDEAFRPVAQEEHVKSPDLLLSPNDSGTCFGPVEDKECLSPNGEEEDEEACLGLTEANAYVKPVEKYILSTKEEGQSLSFSRDRALPEEDRNIKAKISVGDGKSLCSGSFEGNKGSPAHHSIITDKEEQLSSGSQYKDTSNNADKKDVQDQVGRPGGTYGSGDQKQSSCIEGEVKVQKNSDGLVSNMPGDSKRILGNFVKSVSFGSDPANKGTAFSGVTSSSGGMANSGITSDTEAAVTAGVQGRFRNESGEWMVYGGSLGPTSMTLPNTGSKESPSGSMVFATSKQETGRFNSRGSGEWMIYSSSLGCKSSLDDSTSLASVRKEAGPSVATNPATSPQERGRFGSRGNGEWMVYSGKIKPTSSLAHSDSLPNTVRRESLPMATHLPTSPPGSGKFGSRGSGEWRVYGGSNGRISSWAGSNNLSSTDREEIPSVAAKLPTSPPGSGKFGSTGSGEWRVYGGSNGRISSWAGSNNLSSADREEIPSLAAKLPTSPPGSLGTGRFVSGVSGEWRVYGRNTGRLSSADRAGVQMISPPSSHKSSGRRLSSAGSGGGLGSGSVVKRSSSVGSGGRLSSSSGSHRTSTSGRFSSTGSGEWKPVYSSASAHKSGVGSAGRSGGGGTNSSQRAPSPGGRKNVSMGSGGWLSSSTAGGICISSPGSGSKLSSPGSSDRISSQAGGRISSSSGSGRTNSTGGRVITSSDRPIRSTGSGTGGNKERISVCKMAALSISAAGRERSQDRQRQPQQQQKAAGTSPLLQRWLNTGVAVNSVDPDGLDDIMPL